MTSRGKVAVGTSSWHWRWYNQWRNIKGRARTERSQVDLCHYMRVLLIFAPWRWFWQGELLWELPAFLYVLVLMLVGAVVYAFVAATAVMLFVFYLIASVLGAAVILGSIIYAIRRWYIKDKARADALMGKVGDVLTRVVLIVTVPIWYPIYWLVRGVKRAGIAVGGVIYRFGDWLFTKPLFSLTIGGELVTFMPFWLLMAVAMPLLVIIEFVLHPIGFLILLGLFAAAILLIIGLVLLVKGIRRWAREHPPTLGPKAKKEHETTQLVWSWVVSKKHRVCPLIEAKQ